MQHPAPRAVLATLTAVTLSCAACGTGTTQARDNTPQICAQFTTIEQRYTMGDAPELQALNQAIRDDYAGKASPGVLAAARATYFRTVASTLRPLAEQANNPRLKQALNDYVAALAAQAPGAGQAAFTAMSSPVLTICPHVPPSSR